MEGAFYKELLRDAIISKTLSILDELNLSHSANVDVEKKEQLVGGVALTMMWVLLRCGQMSIDQDTNDFIYPSNMTQHQGLAALLQQLLRRRSSNRDLCDDLLQYLTKTSLETEYEHLMSPANKICSLIRILLEMNRCISMDRDLTDRFSTPEFIGTVLNLVEKEIQIFGSSKSSDLTMRFRTVFRLRSLLSLLSVIPMDDERKVDLETRLVDLFRDSHQLPRLTVEDFSALSKELSSIVSLPLTKNFIDRHAASIPEQLQRAEEEIQRCRCVQSCSNSGVFTQLIVDFFILQNTIAELERNVTQSQKLVEESCEELQVLRPKLQQKEDETRALHVIICYTLSGIV